MRYLLLVFTIVLLGGCASALDKKTQQEWNNVETSMGVLGTWTGVTPDGNRIKYVFNKDSTCIWGVGDVDIPCKFGGKKHGDGIRVVIYEMEGKQFENVEFLAWLKVRNDKMMIYGYPVRYGRLQSGEKEGVQNSVSAKSQVNMSV